MNNFMLYLIIMAIVGLITELTDNEKMNARKARVAEFMHRAHLLPAHDDK